MCIPILISLLLLLGGLIWFSDIVVSVCACFSSMEIIFFGNPRLSLIKYVMEGKPFSSRLCWVAHYLMFTTLKVIRIGRPVYKTLIDNWILWRLCTHSVL